MLLSIVSTSHSNKDPLTDDPTEESSGRQKVTRFSTLKGLVLLRWRKDRLRRLPPLDGVLLLGVKLPPECKDLDDNKDCRLLVRALRRMPRRLLFFNNGGRGGFPGEIPRDEELRGEAQAAVGVKVYSVRSLLHFGVYKGDRLAAKLRLFMVCLESAGDGL
jgi:hypothetical protein